MGRVAVVRDSGVHDRVCSEVQSWLLQQGWEVQRTHAWRKREGGREGKGGRECSEWRMGDGQRVTAKERAYEEQDAVRNGSQL